MQCAVPPPRPNAGQASAEYVALLAVVCVVVAGAAAVGSVPPLARDVVAAVKHGICRVAGGVCTTAEARAAGLQPCLVARSRGSRAALRPCVDGAARRGDALLVQRRSDGSAAVSFSDGGTARGERRARPPVHCGSVRRAAAASGCSSTPAAPGSSASSAEAARFVRRWGKTETLGGELRGILPGGARPPRPDSTYVEGGAYSEVAAALGAEAHLDAEGMLGRRVGPGDRTVYYWRTDAETGAHLGPAFGALEAHGAGELGLELTVEHGRATQLRVRGAVRVHGELVTPTAATTLADLISLLRGEPTRPAGQGRRAEVDVTLDMTEPENRRAVVGFLGVARPGVTPGGWPARVRALAHRLNVAGAVDVRLFRVRLGEREVGVDAALLAGAGYDRTAEARDLLQAWSRPPGGTLQEREDCVPA